MFENKGKNEQNTAAKDEIDDFAQALLDKKTEMALLKDMPQEPKKEVIPEREQAEQTLSSALNMLRKERGQVTIEEEEKIFNRSLRRQEQKQEDEVTEEDFTTYSLGKEDLMNASLKNVKNALNDDEDVEDKEVKEKEPKKKEKKAKSKTNTLKKIDPNRKKRNILIAAIVAVVLLLMAGYAYKIYVYDPQNVISEAQQASYDKLVAYADEWDMMSDAEKLEILDMKSDYDSLLDKQKSAINDYFKEQINKTYTTVYKEMKTLKEEQEDESNPDYQEIVAYLTDWASKDDTTKMNIINLKTKYDALSNGLQKKVDDLSRSQTSKSFGALYTEYENIKKQQEEQAAKEAEQQKNEQIAYYQSLLDQAKTDLENYTSYKSSLEQELATAQANGQDTTEILSQIDMNNQLIDQCNTNIQTYQQTIDSLQ